MWDPDQAAWKQKLAARAETTQDEIAAELRKLGFSNLLDYFHITPDGAPVIDLSMLTRAQAAALTEIQVEDAKGKQPGKVRIKLSEKRQALVDLAKLLGHMTDKVKIEGSLDLVARTAKIAEDVRNMTDEELAEYDALERLQEVLLARAHARHQAPALPAYLAGQRPAPELPDRVDSPVTIERRDG
jgi:hypothetical protein